MDGRFGRSSITKQGEFQPGSRDSELRTDRYLGEHGSIPAFTDAVQHMVKRTRLDLPAKLAVGLGLEGALLERRLIASQLRPEGVSLSGFSEVWFPRSRDFAEFGFIEGDHRQGDKQFVARCERHSTHGTPVCHWTYSSVSPMTAIYWTFG
jgi:hypothetical protein